MADPRGPAPLCKSCTHHHHPVSLEQLGRHCPSPARYADPGGACLDFQGEKCPICGHTGKGKAFAMISRVRALFHASIHSPRPVSSLTLSLMSHFRVFQTTGPSSMELHFEGFDRRVDAKLYKNQWTLVRIMRTRIFVDECGVGEELEFDGHEDNSRHVLGLGTAIFM